MASVMDTARARIAAENVKKWVTTTSTNPATLQAQKVAQNVGTTVAPFVPSEQSKAAWDKLWVEGQKALVAKTPTFDPTKYGLTLATAPTGNGIENNVGTQQGTPQAPVEPTVQKYAIGGKGYDINVGADGKASFTSQDGTGQIKHFDSVDAAKAAIDAGNKVTPVNKWKENVGANWTNGTDNTNGGWVDNSWIDNTWATSTYDPQNYNDSQNRLDQITSNLNNIYASKPELFADRDTFNAFFKYWDRSSAQNAILDNFYANKQKEITLNTMTPDAIAKGILNNTYTQNDLTSIHINNPDKYNEVQTAIKNEQIRIQNKNTLMTMAEQAGLWWDKNNNGIVDALETKDWTSIADLSPEQIAANEKYNTIANQISTLDTEINKTEKEISDKYKGTITKWQLASLTRDATNALIDQKNNLVLEWNLVSGQIANMDKQQALRIQKYNTDVSTFNTLQSLFLQTQAQELGKFTTSSVANPLGGVIITTTNTKTGETTTKTVGSDWTTNTGIPSSNTSSTSMGWWVTNAQWNSYTPEQKSQIIDQMTQIEWTKNKDGSPNPVTRYNDPAALTWPSTKAYQDILTSFGWTPVKASNGFTYVQFPSMAKGKAATIAYIDKAGLTLANWKWRWNYLDKIWLNWASTDSSIQWFNPNDVSLYQQTTTPALSTLGSAWYNSVAEFNAAKEAWKNSTTKQQFMDDYSGQINNSANGVQWVDLSGFSWPARNDAIKAANKVGIKTVTDAKSVAAIKTIEWAMYTIDSLNDSISWFSPTSKWDLGSTIANVAADWWIGSSDRVSAIQNLKTNWSQAIATLKSLTAWWGGTLRINQAEINNSIKFDIPTIYDTTDQVSAKYLAVKWLLMAAQDSALSNKPVTRKDVITQVMKSNPDITYPDEYYDLTKIPKPTTAQTTQGANVNASWWSTTVPNNNWFVKR